MDFVIVFFLAVPTIPGHIDKFIADMLLRTYTVL